MRNRRPDSVISCLGEMLADLPFRVMNVYWDKEGSFLSRAVQSWLKDRGIRNYTTTSVVKAPGVERVIRTIRLALSRYFMRTGSFRWTEYLPVFVSNYNNRVHSTTGARPLDVINDPLIVPKERQPTKGGSARLPEVGSFVRLNVLRGKFRKESSGTWTQGCYVG